ncbi:glycosyltransferase family 4 protein [Pseudoalteromonas piscicida]|uniref:Glycosyltransferase family 1 protein n=1 Tax=Pseudoalteromonas piscicida TaxID=43662 RepID=A0A2A5JVT7_PSEO7|nr:glycosyltransferase family 4 protein [Pseudoalteromonas piscicida]PCK33603.1 glycosyltransferase family 1 protein [Pseudoalteromonas piscicida]
MKVTIIGALPSSLVNFRGELLKALKSKGASVTAMANGATEGERAGVLNYTDKYLDYPVARNGLNPAKDLLTLKKLYAYFNSEQPDVVLAYTIKPIIWGGLAARLSGVKGFYALVTGLGYAFQPAGFSKKILIFIVRTLYKVALKRAKVVIFQNPDNLDVFVKQGIVPRCKCRLVNGSGVDLEYFKKTPLSDKPTFLLIARLLGDKGIREYAQAAKRVKLLYPDAIFNLVGPEDPSPDGIKIEEVLKWHEEGIITYHGATKDVRPFISESNVFVLPSYHEGLPRTVLEAMAMGRPILTTDVPGCRETVANGHNGWKVEKANVQQLYEKLLWFIENVEQWETMGENSYQSAKDKFDVHKVNRDIVEIMGMAK